MIARSWIRGRISYGLLRAALWVGVSREYREVYQDAWLEVADWRWVDLEVRKRQERVG